MFNYKLKFQIKQSGNVLEIPLFYNEFVLEIEVKMAKIESFEKYFNEYDNWFVENQNIYKSELEAVKKFVPTNKTGVDIGIGTARFTLPLGVKIGVDPSSKMCEISRSKGVEVFNASAEKLPFDNNMFDFVLSVTSVSYFDNVLAAFTEMYRILKPDGFAVIGFICKNSEFGNFYENKKEQSKFYKEALFYSVNEINEYLKKAGFEKFDYMQTLFNLENMYQEPVSGYDKGSFIVVKAEK